MSQTETPAENAETGGPKWCPDPSKMDKTVEKGGWKSTFSRAFVGRLTVLGRDGSTETLYDQEETPGDVPFCLPKDVKKPDRKSRITIQGGPNGRDVTVDLDDPNQDVAEVHVVFKTAEQKAADAEAWRKWESGAAKVRAYATGDGGGERVVASDNVIMCPPRCPLPPPDVEGVG